mmetsp:Transcript_28981/g.40020  ORF Transcript_28981/g.40020 Transcript_28981/m.40020 type:complete len:172 (-) Transcript_28981:115-630(-)|eukprot:CAMPEP_0196586450 /NCGR_PEP_ID=MMETSP1081-20130531/54337_1 /TAXON_ID=36882 /ORGANISM="Pyramimonas amylifera, Strain CCMP720" /LENGTH=171 /DNA_ID=CAMNT_0041908337 /DNA_START=51 /DNA_END=566 /DNA_ORIENTATION=+
MAEEEGKNAIGIMTGLVAAVAGFQLTKEVSEKFFTAECRQCDGTGRLTCRKCRGYGFLRRAPEMKVNAFGTGADDLDNLQVCPFCSKNPGVFTCTACKGQCKKWLDRPNAAKLWKWYEPHYNALQRYNFRAPRGSETVRTKETKKLLQSGQGGFSMSGSSNALPFVEEPAA